MAETFVCDVCGEAYPLLPRQKSKTCAPCRARLKWKRRSEKRKAQRAEIAAKMGISLLDERMKKADEAGMSYGKYVAMLRRRGESA